uniref:Reverse transcriptase domain-containing protein n=1 Tax=Seriola dumerili TaxID=41447 RepID=A0A3B4TSQ3_SERDU
MIDFLVAADAGKSSILVHVDLSAAFNTVDHSISLECLQHWVGISGSVLKCGHWQVTIIIKMTCGLLFSLYILPLGLTTDDTQFYLSFNPNEAHQVNNFLQLNIDKTEVIAFGPDTTTVDDVLSTSSVIHSSTLSCAVSLWPVDGAVSSHISVE